MGKESQDKIIRNANSRAKKRLQKQYKRTGVMTLGSTSSGLASDAKFKRALKLQSIRDGEELAHASLAAERVVLDTCQSGVERAIGTQGEINIPKSSKEFWSRQSKAIMCFNVSTWNLKVPFVGFCKPWTIVRSRSP